MKLTPSQIVSSVASLLGEELALEATANQDLPPLEQRAMPPLSSLGTTINDIDFAFLQAVAGESSRLAVMDVDGLTGCGDAPTDDCARDFVASFAERAYRRPLGSEERESLLVVYAEVRADGGSTEEAVRYSLWATLESPGFVYRTELGAGDPAAPEIELTPYELASELSYYLIDGPPDDELLLAASRDELATPDEVGAHARRLLATPTAHRNFEAAMMSHFRLPRIPSIVLDPASVPGITVHGGLLAAIHHEAELFLENTLWSGPLAGILVGRTAWVNAEIATGIYGVAAPSTLDADGFGPIALPEPHAGLLGSSPFLTSNSRPDAASVVGRGLSTNAAIACQMNPAFPEDPTGLDDIISSQVGLSEREKADYRASLPQCGPCHALFDPYGLALDVFDSIGRHRTTDPEGRPIDPRVTLPPVFDRAIVSSPSEMAKVMATSDAFEACIALTYADFALADVSQGGAGAPYPEQPATSCTVREILRAWDEAGDASFSGLLVEIARARLLRFRVNTQ